MRRLPAALLLLWSASAAAGDKQELLAAKGREPVASSAERARWERHLRLLVGKPPAPLVNVVNIWTDDRLVLDPAIDSTTFDHFLRCHFTDQPADMDMRLLGVLAGAARRFTAREIDIVSGFRAPKYNLMLRKKGREVARDSQHTHGHAVDFRIPGVRTRQLLDYVKSLRLGGAGYYPQSEFVHADTGPIRTWAAQ